MMKEMGNAGSVKIINIARKPKNPEECGAYSGSDTGKRSRRVFRKEIELWISAAVFCLATQAAMLLVFLDWLSKGN